MSSLEKSFHLTMSNRKIIVDQELLEDLSQRTSVSMEVINTIIHYYHRMILQRIKHKEDVVLEHFIKIIHLNDRIIIEFTEKAKKLIK